MTFLRKLRNRYILLSVDAALFLASIVAVCSLPHPLGSTAHMCALIFGAILGGLVASIDCDRYLLKIYKDRPHDETIRGLL